MLRLLFCLAVLLMLPGLRTAGAQDSGLAFLRIGPDAEGMALGDTGVSHTTGAFASERNPAGLVAGEGTVLGLTHHQWLGDVSTYGLAGRFDAGRFGGLGLYARATGSSGLEARDRPGPADGTFDVQFVAVGAAFARAFGPVTLGAGGKYLSERIYSVSASGIAFDVGARLSLASDAIRLGAALQNSGSMQDLSDRPTELPTTVSVGASIEPLRVLSFDDGATLLDAVLTVEFSRNTVDSISKLHLGAAANVLETVRVSLGYISNDALRDLSAGVGFSAGTFRLDYALLPFEEGFGGPGHVFTLSYGKGG